MKQCPQCQRVYPEGSVRFCLDDGTVLANFYDPEATQIIPPIDLTEPLSHVTPTANASPPQIIKQGVSPYFAYALVGLLAMLVAGGAVVIFYERNRSSSSSNSSQSASPITPPSSPPRKAPPADRRIRLTGVQGKYPEGSTRLLTNDDLANKAFWELRVMRNEIYARRGYIFNNIELRDYFGKQSWYKPMYDDVTDSLNDVEKANILFLKSYE